MGQQTMTMNKRNESRSEWLNDLALGLKQEFNLDHNESLKRAASLMDKVGSVRAAGMYYWPAASRDNRNTAISGEFNGRNLPDVKRKYGVPWTRSSSRNVVSIGVSSKR